jgi:hypothetical protein
MLVGLPVVAFGERILRINIVLLMVAAGIGGALVMELPLAAVSLLEVRRGGLRWSWTVADFVWPGIAFGIAGAAGWLYRWLLRKDSRVAVPAPTPAP